MRTPTVIYLTSGSSWMVPSDWSSSANTIECIGAGGSGASLYSQNYGGGGGGAYSAVANLALTAGAMISYGVGIGGASVTGGGAGGNAGGNTWFNGTSLAACSIGAQGGQGGSTSGSLPAAPGGQASAGTGATKYSGGNGGAPNLYGGSGGGGGAGANGPGNNGTAQSGGNTTGTNGGSGDAGSGGAGGTAVGGGGGNPGAAGTEYDATHGAGGGGAGGSYNANAGGAGGKYGGGGGGAAYATGTSGAGAAGLIRISYNPASGTTVTSDSSVAGESAGRMLSDRTLTNESTELIRRGYGAGLQTIIFRRVNRPASAWMSARSHRRSMFFTGAAGGAMLLEWAATAGGPTLSAHSFALLELLTGVRGDPPAPIASSPGVAFDFRGPVEAAALQRSDAPVDGEFARAVARDSGAPIENLGGAASVNQDSFVPVESLSRGQANASIAGEISSGIGADASTRAEWLTALRAAPALRVEILSRTRADRSAPFENTGALTVANDSLAPLENLAGVSRDPLALVETLDRLTADTRGAAEWSSTVSLDGAAAIETPAGVLRVGAGFAVEFHAAGYSSLVANAGAAIEYTARATADAPARLESLGQAIVAIDIFAASESATGLRSTAPAAAEGLVGLSPNRLLRIEAAGSLVRDISAASESAGVLLRSDPIAVLELLTDAAGDVWVVLESGFLIPATLLSVERGRIVATPGRLRILKVY
jgi:hypothetical protein